MTEQAKCWITSCVLFEDIPWQKVCALLEEQQKTGSGQRVQLKNFAKGQDIYTPEHYQRSLGIISRGIVVVEKENGVLLNELDVGRCFGAAALFVTQERYVTTVRAKTACQVLFLSMEAMQEMMMQYPQIALNYIRFLSGRIQFLNRRIDSFIAPSAEESLLSYLRQQPEGISRELPMSRLAELLNLGRTSIYRAAEHLEQQGMIRREGRCIQLTESISREIAEPVSREITAGISQETTAPEIKKG